MMLFLVQLIVLSTQFFIFYPCLLGAQAPEAASVDNVPRNRVKRDFAPPNPQSDGAQGVAPQAPGFGGEKDKNLRYEPNWESLEKRPLPKWYDDAKLGIFIHWGVYSVPSLVSEWFWYYWRTGTAESKYHTQTAVDTVRNFMSQNYPPDFKYTDFANKFTGEFFDPAEWVDIFRNSGAK